MHPITATIALVLVLGSAAAQAQTEHQLAHPKKLIEWGWDEPDPKFMRSHIQEMERLPFDGLVFHVSGSKGGSLTWQTWGDRKLTADQFQQAVEDLKATKFHRFTDRFLRVNITPGRVDWFDDQAWATVLNNVAVAARVAQQGGCKGFMFDVEQYEGQPFNYHQQKHHSSKPFADYQQKVRQRGKEWMQAVNREFPDITILLTFGHEIAQPRGKAKDRSQVGYGLLADFLDGMLDACSKKTTLVDAWEFAYGYKQPRQFERAYQTTRKQALNWTAVPQKYRDHMRVGFGLWLDNNWRRKGWDVQNPTKNYFSPAAFETAVRAGLRRSDEYVWIYTEQPRWWSNQKLPPAYIEALRRAHKQP